jgi:hypothetical protein
MLMAHALVKLSHVSSITPPPPSGAGSNEYSGEEIVPEVTS